ncbi:hypothetical protein ERJ75_000221300 [Trypanosoma vivax]|nr:hypothetical protein ERJ75_000221300 [Trypanosoma vivax]
MHKLALAVFCVIAARTSQRALAGEPNAGITVEDFRKVCVATHALGAVKSLSEAIAGRVKEATASARGWGGARGAVKDQAVSEATGDTTGTVLHRCQ